MAADRGRTLALASALAVAVLVATGCSGGDGEDELSPGTTGEVTTPTAPAIPAPSPAGAGVVVIGGTTSSVAVTECRLEPDPAVPEGARPLLLVKGAGTTGRGVPFTVEVQRFATSLDGAVTFTDTIAYTDAARILQAQRIEVGGEVMDLRDPEATSALLRPRADGVSGAGLAGAPGDDADDEGVVGIALDLTCA
ncbi:MAG: hypothetical protein ACRDPQ_06415 [Nocardioidaceae bacterium]